MKNCPNCGAPLVPYSVHCAYCGTYYYDLTAFDCSKQCFVKFKTIINGEECAITALAIPSLEEMTVEREATEAIDSFGHVLMRIPSRNTCTIKARFTCVANPEDKSLVRIETKL